MTTSSVIARAGVLPVHREPNLRSERVTEMVLGETARVLESQGEWRRIKCDLDRYEGWIHRGYVLETDHEIARGWRESAAGWSEGAVVRTDAGIVVRLPVRARVGLAAPRVDLPDGSQGTVIAGSIVPYNRVVARAHGVTPDLWALRNFPGTPYQWGGVTPWGVDCSGLVQTTFLARGIHLPRDASQQAGEGKPVEPGRERQGDLLFFSDRGGPITHVAISGPAGTLVHSTVALGGFVMEPWGPGSRAIVLRAQLVGIRRVSE